MAHTGWVGEVRIWQQRLQSLFPHVSLILPLPSMRPILPTLPLPQQALLPALRHSANWHRPNTGSSDSPVTFTTPGARGTHVSPVIRALSCLKSHYCRLHLLVHLETELHLPSPYRNTIRKNITHQYHGLLYSLIVF